ncbi:MAG: 5-formyltetrahydrofolate cyclo-ligase [Brevinema sp.]
MLKQQLRDEAKAYVPSYNSDEIREKFARNGAELLKKYGVCAFFSSIGHEPDLSLLVEKAVFLDKTILYPRVEGDRMVFSPVNKENPLVLGAFSILEPQTPPFLGEIDLIFIPGLMFGANGSRLGRGKGYYDRFLSHCNALKIGVCFEYNVREAVPEEAHDIRMDGILTENQLIWC